MLRIACFANNAMSKIDTSGDPNQYPEPSSSHTLLVYMDVIKETNSELVYLHKFSIDPIRRRINHDADQKLLHLLSCLIKKRFNTGRIRPISPIVNPSIHFTLHACASLTFLTSKPMGGAVGYIALWVQSLLSGLTSEALHNKLRESYPSWQMRMWLD